jgi:WD40 repeat protein/tRNA A-37 threonylcarbamoyl transferase component Bud32
MSEALKSIATRPPECEDGNPEVSWQVVATQRSSMPPPPVLDRTETLAPRPSARTELAKDLANDSTDAAPVRISDSVRAIAPADDPDRYEQIGEHARGGLGRVVRAVDKRLGRTVAVKELLRHDASNEARFLREAMITARLEHPGIVPVHEAGRWPNGDPYYVMKLVEGRTLKELIDERKTLRERLALLPHVIAIADAVGYAHSEGVIHRDLKPSNVIVGEFGETIVVDWGLARDRKRNLPEPLDAQVIYAVGGSGASTVSGKVVGTPAYMSPEQARGELVDERADVYAIGTVLYELLAGLPPHHDETPQATLDRVIAGPPRPLTELVPHVPGELATIVAKAMARRPDDRYANASLLAEDLRRFNCGKLVSAHSYTAWSLLRKKLAQHRGVVAVAVASVVALGAVGVGSFRRVVAERNIARSERARAFESQAQSEKRQRELVLLQAATSLRKDPTAALAWLKDYEPTDGDRAQVGALIDEALAAGVARHVFRTGDWVWDAVFTPDGKTVVARVRDGSIRAYDVPTGDELVLGRTRSTPEELEMSPDGRFVVVSDLVGEVTVWPLDGGRPRVLVQGGPPSSKLASQIRLSADGARVLVLREGAPPTVYPVEGGAPAAIGAAAARRITVADRDWTRQLTVESFTEVVALEGAARRTLAKTSKPIRQYKMSPRGDTVLIHDGEAIWLVPFAGGPLRKLAPLDAELQQAVWSPDERTIAIGAKGGEVHDIKLVDVATGAVSELRGHTDANYTLQWSRDGRRLLSASDDATARVWTVADGRSIVLRGHDDDVVRARFSFNESLVLTASLDGSIRVWRIDQPGSRVLVAGDRIESLRLGGDRALVRTSKEVAWWNVASGHRVPLFSWGAERGVGFALPSRDGEHLLVVNTDGAGEVRHRGRPTTALLGQRAPILVGEFSRDGAALFTSSKDGALRRWDVATGQGTLLFQGASPVRQLAVAAAGRVAFEHEGAMHMIERDGTDRVLGKGAQWAAWTEFEEVKDRLVLRRYDQSFAIVDGDRLIELPAELHSAGRIAVSPDGTRIAAALGDRTARVWEAATGRVLDVLRGHSDLVKDVAFSPDGQRLASSSYDNTVRLWQLGTGRSRVLRGHSASVDQVEWARPEQLVTGSVDGTLRVWDVPSLAPPTAAELDDRLARATTAKIDIDRPTTGAPRPRGI